MNGTQFAIAAIAATAGGTIGAIGTALLSWSHLQSAASNLQSAVETAKKGGDPVPVATAAEDLLSSIGILGSALGKLKDSLRIR